LKTLLVYHSSINAVEILDINLVALNGQLGVSPADTSFLAAMWVCINIGENTADWIFTTNDNVLFSFGYWYRNIWALQHQSTGDKACWC
jgi:hypothetical protein